MSDGLIRLGLDAGEKLFRRKRQRCLMLADIAPGGPIISVTLLDEYPPSDIPVLPITLAQFYIIARQHGLTARPRLSEEEQKRRKQISLDKYRDKQRRQAQQVKERQL